MDQTQSTPPVPDAPATHSAALFERKVRGSVRAIVFEHVWRRLWVAFALIALFLFSCFAGLWPLLPNPAHIALLGLFVIGLLAALFYVARAPVPSRDEAIRRMERQSGLPHRPATSYEDKLSVQAADPATSAIWTAHRARLAALLSKLKVGPPAPGTHRLDPMALRALAGLSLLLWAGLLGDRAYDRLASAFRFGPPPLAADARLDAWATPPPYTGKAPVMLADGQRPGVSLAQDDGRPFEIPDRSVLIVRATGTGGGEFTAEYKPDGAAKSETLKSTPVAGVSGVAELRTEIRKSGSITISGQPKPWVFSVTPDHPPKITLLKEPEPNQRGSMKLQYRVEDDYGVVSAEAKFARAAKVEGDEKTAWARTNTLKGPRYPYDRPPRYALRLPQPGPGSNGKQGDAMTYLELGSHPWAGLRVRMWLEAKDAAGQIGRTEPREIDLPQRRFTKPLARALIEQRRKLVDDPRYRGEVVRAMNALMIAPEGFTPIQAYLGMRTVVARLQADRTRAAVRSSIAQLWHIALRLEDGNLSDAERRLKDAQDKLSKALDEGASEEEIERLMKELRQAMNEYIEQLAKNAEPQDQNGEDQERQQLGQNDLEQMMRRMEQAAKNGARDQAQQMLSEMRDLMDRLQAQKGGEKGDREAQRQMQKNMDELGNVIGQQQKLLDDTFGEMKRQADRGSDGEQERGQQGGKGKPGGKGEQSRNPGEKGQGGKGKQNAPGSKGEGNEPGDTPGEMGGAEGSTPGDGGASQNEALRQRQQKLTEQLDRLKQNLNKFGANNKDFDAANEAMADAERALQDGDLDDATGQQSTALDKMRQGAQKMQQEMAKNGRQRYGENGDTPRDPLGRPQKSQGPDAGASVKVPGEIDMQRAREILQELRKRSAEQTRPPVELDYLERLLKRF